MVALMATIGLPAMAEDIIWQEDFSTFAKDSVPTGGTYNYSCTNGTNNGSTKIYNDKLAGGTAPELLIAKAEGSFTAEIPLGGKSGEMTLSYYTNKTITANSANKDVVIGEAVKSGNNYTMTVTVPAGLEKLVLSFVNTSGKTTNARFDDVKLYQGTAKKAAGLSWGTASRLVTIGADDNVFPTLTNENNLAVTYTSDSTHVATIDANGVITLVAAGNTTISASFAGNDEYEAQTVSYTLTVKAATGGGEGGNPEPEPQPVETTGKGTLESPYTVADILAVVSAMEAGKVSEQDYYIKGTISSIKYTFSAQYGTATFNISDDGSKEKEFTCYGVLTLENKAWVEGNIQIEVGDEVIICGKVVNYNGTTPETSNKNAYTYSINGKTKNEGGTTPIPAIELITIERALEIINDLEDGGKTTTQYGIEGYVTSLVEEFNPQYGNYTFIMSSGATTRAALGELTVFRAKNADNQKFVSDVLKVNDKVLVQGYLQKYVKDGNMTPELVSGIILTINDQSTGITTINATERFDGAIYNLRGQRITTPAKGLYICNGKKFFVK